MHSRACIVLLSVVLFFVALPAAAQEEVLPWPSLPNPGARSLGLGGAFAAQADDATAAFANPAGLVQLLRPEFSLELRLWGDDDELTDNAVDDLTGVSFASFVLPRGDWAVAAYRHQLARFDLDREIFAGDDGTTAEVIVTGLSLAYRVSDRVLIGMGATYNEGEVRRPEASGRGTDWGLTGGVVWRPHRQLQVGGFYRQGPSLESSDGSSAIVLPNVAGAGVALRSDGGHWTLAAELDRVMVDGLSAEAHEAHLGCEYAFLGSPVFAVRAGAWREIDSDRPGGGDRTHLAGGFGFAGRRFQLDFAADVADTVWTASTSAIVSF